MDKTVGTQVNPVDCIDNLIDDPREHINCSCFFEVCNKLRHTSRSERK